MCDTSLHLAVRLSDVEEVLDALESGCNPNQIGLYQWAPLHEAASLGLEDIIALLIKYGATVDLPDELKGARPLHYAAEADNGSCLQALLDAGADHTLKDEDGMSCISRAGPACKELLVQHEISVMMKEEKLRSSNQLNFVNEHNQSDNKARSGESKQNAENQYHSTSGTLCDQILDCEDHNTDSSCAASNPTSDEMIESLDVSPDANETAGSLELSFEYHSHHNRLKIRVWRFCDFTLPQETHGSVAVRSKLVPDPQKSLKRSTTPMKLFRDSSVSEDIIFNKALQYERLLPEDVNCKQVQIELRLVTKLHVTTVGYVHLPLSVAVKKLFKYKYPLLRSSTKLPAHVQIVTRKRAAFIPDLGVTHSNIDVRSKAENITPDWHSDSDLRAVLSEQPRDPHIAVPIFTTTSPCDTTLSHVKVDHAHKPERTVDAVVIVQQPEADHTRIDVAEEHIEHPSNLDDDNTTIGEYTDVESHDSSVVRARQYASSLQYSAHSSDSCVTEAMKSKSTSKELPMISRPGRLKKKNAIKPKRKEDVSVMLPGMAEDFV